MSRLGTSFIALTALLLLQGCGAILMGGTETTQPTVRDTLPLAGGTGLISGTRQNAVTSGGYRVNSSIGQWTPAIKVQTSGGSTVYQTEQGIIAAE